MLGGVLGGVLGGGLERSDSSIPPSTITNTPPFVASLLTFAPQFRSSPPPASAMKTQIAIYQAIGSVAGTMKVANEAMNISKMSASMQLGLGVR